MRISKRQKVVVVFGAAAMSVASPVSAAYTIAFQQVGANVVSTGSGSLNLTALTVAGGIGGPGQILASQGLAILGQGAPGITATGYSGISGPASFGTSSNIAADFGTGPFVGIWGTQNRVWAPIGYVSGDPLGISTATYQNDSFASLGLTQGTYVWTWGQGVTADSFTVQIGPAAAGIPEPSTWAIMMLGLGFVGGAMRSAKRRQRLALSYA